MQERLNFNNSKRDMRKKVVKSDRPTYKKRIKKVQQGIKFVSYNALDTPTIDYKDITNPINPFSEYNYSTTYNKPEALVVPVRDNDVVATDDVVVDKPTAVASKVVVNNTANSTWKSPYRDRSKWVADLTSAYKRAGITNDNAIKMLLAQDALESGWGKSAQGKFNFGNLTTGAKWKGDYVTGNDKNAKGEAIKQRFRSYNSMDEYAADKIQFLKRLYDFNENDDINKFTAKLTGANKGKRRYAEAKEYANSLRGVYNSFKAGGIIKYQNSGKLVGRYSDSKGEEGLLAELPEVTVIGNKNYYLANKWNGNNIQLTSEMPVRAYVNNNGQLDYARQYNPSAGYVSGTDPLGEFVVGNAVLNKPLQLVGRAAEYGLAKAGNNWARNRVVGRAINNEVNNATSIGDLLKGRGFGESNNFKLPDYATPNSTANPIDSHALRLSNGGFDKLPRTVDGKTHFDTGSFSWPYKSESMATNLYSYDRNPAKWVDNLSADFSKASKGVASPNNLHSWALNTANNEALFATSGTGNIYAGRQGLTSTAKEFGEGNINRLLSHEMDHAIHVPGESPKGFDLNYLTKSTPKRPEYFTIKNSTELSARGTQLKDYFGLTSPDQELTEDMLRYAAKNYIKDTGADNNMTAFFNSVVDWKEAAKWLSKWSSVIAVPLIITNKTNDYVTKNVR